MVARYKPRHFLIFCLTRDRQCPARGKPLTEDHKLLLVIRVPVFDHELGKWIKELAHPVGDPNLN